MRGHLQQAISSPDEWGQRFFGGCDKEDGKNPVATGKDSGLELVDPCPANENGTLVLCNPKGITVRPASKAKNVTWADIARLKAKPKYKIKVMPWSSQHITLVLEERIKVDSWCGVCRFANPSQFRS